MQAFRRAADNAALTYASSAPTSWGCPASSTRRCGRTTRTRAIGSTPSSCEGARDTAERLARAGHRHTCSSCRATPDEAGESWRSSRRAPASCVRRLPELRRAGAERRGAARVACPFVVVDDCAVVPLALLAKPEVGSAHAPAQGDARAGRLAAATRRADAALRASAARARPAVRPDRSHDRRPRGLVASAPSTTRWPRAICGVGRAQAERPARRASSAGDTVHLRRRPQRSIARRDEPPLAVPALRDAERSARRPRRRATRGRGRGPRRLPRAAPGAARALVQLRARAADHADVERTAAVGPGHARRSTLRTDATPTCRRRSSRRRGPPTRCGTPR